MTDSTPPDAVEGAGGEGSGRSLDVSLINLPVDLDPGNAEVGCGRWPDHAAKKRRFWRTIAKRLDLSGPGSLVTERPYGTGHDELIAASEARLERLFETLTKNKEVLVLTSDGPSRDSQLHRHVAHAVKEVTPQFFLRNVPRVERHTSVRHLNYQFAVWREDQSHLIEAARKPQLEPVDFLSELSTELIKQLKLDAWERVYGLDWENDVGDFKPAGRSMPVFGVTEVKRIPIEELKDEPSYGSRETSTQRHAKTMNALAKRFDASNDR